MMAGVEVRVVTLGGPRQRWRKHAHALLREAVAEVLGMGAGQVLLERDGAGKLHVAGAPLECSISYSEGLLALALAPTGFPVGVDIERLRPVPFAPEIAGDFLPPSLRGQVTDRGGLLGAWTVLEASLKSVGQRLGDGSTGHVLRPYRTVVVGGAVCTVALDTTAELAAPLISALRVSARRADAA